MLCSIQKQRQKLWVLTERLEELTHRGVRVPESAIGIHEVHRIQLRIFPMRSLDIVQIEDVAVEIDPLMSSLPCSLEEPIGILPNLEYNICALLNDDPAMILRCGSSRMKFSHDQ